MADITDTPTQQSLSFMNFASKYEFNDSLWSNSFMLCDGNFKTQASAFLNVISTSEAQAVNLFYLPDIAETFMYDYLKLDKTIIDLTVTTLDVDLSQCIAEQIDNTDVRFKFMWLNKYEFLIVFYIDCDYITDINLTAIQNTDNAFIRSFEIKKQILTPSNIIFRFYHRFQ